MPGGLKVRRRARLLHDKLNEDWRTNRPNPLLANDWLSIYAMAVNVENARVPMAFVPFEGIPAVYKALADVPHAVVAELPFPEPERVAVNATAVHASVAHWKPLLNGYSGYTPRSYVEHYLAFESFPAPSAIDTLRRAGVTHIVIDAISHPDVVAAYLGA